MKNIDTLKKEALDKWTYHSTGTNTTDFILQLIDHTHAATVEECIGVMPEEYSDEYKTMMDSHTKALQMDGRSKYRTEAISRLQTLLP